MSLRFSVFRSEYSNKSTYRDHSLTLAQNYKRLGLTSKLNGRTGGTEKTVLELADFNNIAKQHHDPLAIHSSGAPSNALGDVQVERDPETGAILQITDPSWKKSNPLGDPLNDLSGDEADSPSRGDESNGVVRQLQRQAAVEVKKKPRHQSQREEEWIRGLVEKYGDDYARMARDKKLNPYQQSEGDIKRRVRQWVEKRGVQSS